MQLEFSQLIFEKAQISSFINTSSVVAELFHADGRTDMTNIIVAFRNIANAPINLFSLHNVTRLN